MERGKITGVRIYPIALLAEYILANYRRWIKINVLVHKGKTHLYLDDKKLADYDRILSKEELSLLINDPLCMFKLSGWKKFRLRPRGIVSRKIHKLKRCVYDFFHFLRRYY